MKSAEPENKYNNQKTTSLGLIGKLITIVMFQVTSFWCRSRLRLLRPSFPQALPGCSCRNISFASLLACPRVLSLSGRSANSGQYCILYLSKTTLCEDLTYFLKSCGSLEHRASNGVLHLFLSWAKSPLGLPRSFQLLMPLSHILLQLSQDLFLVHWGFHSFLM